ncbi:MAG: endonuclease/exonuclease/phosphatase family protein [Pseudomonadota bacterium]
MPHYNDLRPTADFERRDYALVFPNMQPSDKARALHSLLRLKAGLTDSIPHRKSESNLLIASWNIKEFGHTTQRLPEAFFYIAETLSHFDLIALQEVKSSLKHLNKVMRILGSDWDYIVNDITDGKNGNSESSAYLYNTKRVGLSGLAGEIVIWDELIEDVFAEQDPDSREKHLRQLKRTPYVTGFKAGWKSFALVNVHLHPGDDDDDVALRRDEVSLLLAALQRKRAELWNKNLVLTGDFNFYKLRDATTVARIHAAGFNEVDGLLGKPTNASGSQTYDRFFINAGEYFKLVRDAAEHTVGGVFNPFSHVYRDDDWAAYRAEMLDDYTGSKDLENDEAALQAYYRNTWRRNQLSDHLPIWFELQIDSSTDFLAEKAASVADDR